MRNDPSKEPKITGGRTFIMEVLTRLFIEDTENDKLLIEKMLSPKIIKTLLTKITAAGWRVGMYPSHLNSASNVFCLNPKPGTASFKLIASDFTYEEWKEILAYLEAIRSYGCFKLTQYHSPAQKNCDYYTIYGAVDNLIRDVRILFAAYF